MLSKRWPLLLATIFLASCSKSPTQLSVAQIGVEGEFKTPAADGHFEHNLIETQSDVIDDTVSFLTGHEVGVGVSAFAGILPNQPAQAPLSAQATFTGNYRAAIIRDISIIDNELHGKNALTDEGTITLDADLSEMTLIGSDGFLSVDAQIVENTRLEGDVEINGVPGTLIGEIGDDRAFGAFQGGDETNLMSGGFVTTRNP